MPGAVEFDYFVTGGAGFIGSHLCELLLSKGKSVLVLDDLSTGTLSNLDECAGNKSFRFEEGSVLNESLTGELLHQCRTVIHLAAAVAPRTISPSSRKGTFSLLPYISEVEVMNTGVFDDSAAISTFSVPFTLVSIVSTGWRIMFSTPTAAAR